MQRITLIKGTVLLAGLLSLSACTMETGPEVQNSDSSGSDPAKPTKTSETKSNPTPVEYPLPDLGPAPDITNEVWLNTDSPLTLAALRGKVVLLEFWTFG